jgi:hypothetical protein
MLHDIDLNKNNRHCSADFEEPRYAEVILPQIVPIIQFLNILTVVSNVDSPIPAADATPSNSSSSS